MINMNWDAQQSTMPMSWDAPQSTMPMGWNAPQETMPPNSGADDYEQMLSKAQSAEGGMESAVRRLPDEAERLHRVTRLVQRPQSAHEAYQSSWKALLTENLGRRAIVSFLIGTQNAVVVEGTLHEVGTDYLVIYQPTRDSFITADLYSVKFVEFPTEQRTGIHR